MSLDIQFIEDGIYQSFIENLGLSAAEYTGQDAKMVIVGKYNGGLDLFTGSFNRFYTMHRIQRTDENNPHHLCGQLPAGPAASRTLRGERVRVDGGRASPDETAV